MSTISESTFSGLVKLTALDLQNNHLKSLPDYSFKDCTSLEAMFIQENRLTTITEHSLTGLKQLQMLNGADNKITFIHEKAFAGMNRLKIASFKSNKIRLIYARWFQAGVLHSAKDARFLLDENEWYCGCDATPFKLWLEGTATNTSLSAERTNKDFFFRISEIDEKKTGLPCFMKRFSI